MWAEDRLYRWIAIAAVAGLLAVMGLGILFSAEKRSQDEACRRDPESCAGLPVIVSLYDVVAIEGPSRFRVGRGPYEYAVEGPTDGLSVGLTVSIGGQFARGGVRADWVEPHEDRVFKEVLGIAGAGLTLLLLPLGFAITGRRVRTRG